jgi:hypothetical protein
MGRIYVWRLVGLKGCRDNSREEEEKGHVRVYYINEKGDTWGRTTKRLDLPRCWIRYMIYDIRSMAQQD